MPLINLVLNSNNVIGNNNSQFRYRFLNGAFNVPEGSEMCVSQIVVPYSWFNINSTYYQNQTIQYRFYYGAGLFNTYTVTFPNGFYAVSDLNNYLQQYMITQNQYLINNSTGQYLYFIEIFQNTTYYANQIICFSEPTSLPTGYTAPPAGFNYNNSTAYGYPTTTLTPQVVIPSYTGFNGFGSIIGFLPGTYPATAQTTTYNVLSNTTPNATPVNSVVVQCDKCRNECTIPSNVLDSFSITSTFGSNINYSPSYEKWIKLDSGQFNDIVITLADQNFNLISANDPNVLISLLINLGPSKK